MILTLTSGAPGASTLTIVNDGASTGYDLLAGATFGSPVWDHSFSAPRGTQGARASQGRLPNRVVTLPIRVAGATKDAMAAGMKALAATVDECRRFGGTCRMRSKSQTYAQNFEVLTATIDLPSWDNRLEQRFRGVVQVTLTCGPYVLGDPMDVFDDFSVDNVNAGAANYTADAGALANLAVSGGRLNASANLAVENRLVWTGTGYTLGDHEATVRFAPAATIASFKAGVLLKRIDASNYLVAYVDDNGVNSRLRIDKVVAGVTTNLATTNLGARIVAGRWAWARGRIEGNIVYVEHFIDTDYPNPALTPTTSTSYTLSTAEAATFGSDVEGKAGLVFTPQAAGAYIEDFEVLPFTYRNPPLYVLDCSGAIPGDAPALASARMTPQTGVTLPGEWGMLAWAPRPSVSNLVPYGGFEGSVIGRLWSVAAVAGVTGAATSIAQVSDATLGVGARYGENVGQVVCPATANTGATYPMYRRFRKGVTYTATAWLRASSGTTTARIRLGVSGDIASSTAVALSTTWTQHTITWTPTADVDLAYFAAEITAATAQTFQIDGVSVYQGTTAPTGRQAEGNGASPPLLVLAAENGATTASGTRTADAAANAGFAMEDSSVAATGLTYTFTVPFIDPGLISSDDYSGGAVTVEVWARIMLSGSFTGTVTAVLDAAAENGAGGHIYPTEFGSAGRTLQVPNVGANGRWRITRLGTLELPASASSTRYLLTLTVTITAGTNLTPFGIDDFFIVPIRSRFASPSGKISTGYPSFMNLTLGGWRTIQSDLSSSIETITTSSPTSGIVGAMLELPTGEISVLGITSSMCPDRPSLLAGTDSESFPSLHLAVTPRWHWLRDA